MNYFCVRRTITELEAQLDYERLRREKLEAQLDEYRREISEMKYQLQSRVYGEETVSKQPNIFSAFERVVSLKMRSRLLEYNSKRKAPL